MTGKIFVEGDADKVDVKIVMSAANDYAHIKADKPEGLLDQELAQALNKELKIASLRWPFCLLKLT